jgi:hypothetical protein
MSGFVIYRQVTGNLSGGSDKYTLAGLDEYSYGCFNDITKDDMYLYAVGLSNTDPVINRPVIYRQPIDNFSGGGELYTLVGLDSYQIFTGVKIDSKYIYVSGTTDNGISSTGILYRQPINTLSGDGSLYTLDNIPNENFSFNKLQIDSNYIYISGIKDTNLQGILYRQPINTLSGGGGQYMIVDDNLVFSNLAIDSQYITLVGSFTTTTTNVFGLIYRQPIDNLLGGGKKYTLTGLDKYTDVQFSDLKINNGFIYACGFSLLDNLPYGIVYKQSIDQKYANPFLQQDSNLSILNAGNEILKQSIDLLITYIET